MSEHMEDDEIVQRYVKQWDVCIVPRAELDRLRDAERIAWLFTAARLQRISPRMDGTCWRTGLPVEDEMRNFAGDIDGPILSADDRAWIDNIRIDAAKARAEEVPNAQP